MNDPTSLYTEVRPSPFFPKISYRDKILMLGSCFAEHISLKLNRYKYQINSNPFGILFNPASITNSVERICREQYYHEEELVYTDGLYHSLDHHGSYSGTDAEKVIEKINLSIEDAYNLLKHCRIIFISLGSSKVYRYKSTGRIVGNCHKIPQNSFESFTLTLTACEKYLDLLTRAIRELNDDIKIIWTVSPVRHLRDGVHENQISKSTLLLSIENHMKVHPHESYFPAYEIMMDQLRDYRFYARDLVHPSPLAIDIIWDVFKETYLESSATTFHDRIEKVHRAMEHRFLTDQPDIIRDFARKQLMEVEKLTTDFPEMDLKNERQYFFRLAEPD